MKIVYPQIISYFLNRKVEIKFIYKITFSPAKFVFDLLFEHYLEEEIELPFCLLFVLQHLFLFHYPMVFDFELLNS